MMMEGYLGEIQFFAGATIPNGWMPCDGRSLKQSDYAPLFAVIGSVYGFTTTTFNIPDLRGRVACGAGTNREGKKIAVAQQGGMESVTLRIPEIPAHSHQLNASNKTATTNRPDANVLAQPVVSGVAVSGYNTVTPDITLNAATVSTTPNNVPHDNMQPYTVVNYIICVNGLFPGGGDSEDYLGMIKLFAGTPPNGYVLCTGNTVPVISNQALFSVIKNYFGGDGRTSFAYPNLLVAVPMCWNNYSNPLPGTIGGSSAVTLQQNQMPNHTHTLIAGSANGSNNIPANGNTLLNVFNTTTSVAGQLYGIPGSAIWSPMSSSMINVNGGNQAHENMQPYLGLNYYICTQGAYPAQQ